jgi:hypothetical protein
LSEGGPGTQGPPRVWKEGRHDAFAQGWNIESVEPPRNEVRPDRKDLPVSEGRPRAWLAVVRRLA